ncbi:hypothetical protein [Streptomyces sp. P17]|uniref:restriction system modified-DNA reader domain-containing protein n=1 Tax=Streptomyces sp. P17 TaxID=3074716 RepID=UPI0028F42FFC|nr:hypothetical protein [Streptomyces sp. P17]MDT9701876.1 hypothetical protein [Streptomyces sp. P17]
MSKPMRTIQIDEEVFAYLQRHSEPLVDTPNDVLRRELLKEKAASADDGGGTKSPAAVASKRRPGRLMPIIEAGLASPGDKLRHHQSRLKRTYEATITTDGWVQIPDGQEFPQPSPALRTQTGNEINGWGQYTHVPSGRPLQKLREEAAEKTQK